MAVALKESRSFEGRMGMAVGDARVRLVFGILSLVNFVCLDRGVLVFSSV